MSRIIVWFIGQNEWRGMITAIWYERTKLVLGTELYNGVDGILASRYREDIRRIKSEENGQWVPDLINEVMNKSEESLTFVDMGLEGEYDLREWLKGSKHRCEAFGNDLELSNIVMHWGSTKDVKLIRSWFKGNLGVFNERAFEENLYYEDLVSVRDDWSRKKVKWSEIIRSYNNIRRGKLKFAEDHIIANLMKTLDKQVSN